MKPAEFRYIIERTYAEATNINDWLLSDDQFLQFVSMAKIGECGKLVIENWKIYLDGGGDPDDFFDWWEKYRPDKSGEEKEQSGPKEEVHQYFEGKKSPFDAVRENLGKNKETK